MILTKNMCKLLLPRRARPPLYGPATVALQGTGYSCTALQTAVLPSRAFVGPCLLALPPIKLICSVFRDSYAASVWPVSSLLCAVHMAGSITVSAYSKVGLSS